jgi:hypothetical protein
MLKYIIPFSLLVLTACSGEPKDQSKADKTDKSVVVSFQNEVEMNNRMVEIDALVGQNDKYATSLNYMKEDGTSIKVLAYLNKNNEILKIEEVFTDVATQELGSILYYMNNGKPFITRELLDVPVAGGDKRQFLDRVSYYDAKGKVIKTKERRADFQDITESMAYKPVKSNPVRIDRALRALNAEKEFETTFQGFAYQEALTYLIVGENKENGFTSSLKCDFKDGLLTTLMNKPQTQLGKPLNVTFVVEEDQGLEYQVYTGGSFKK